jgi:H+/Cl- antiporter ClcA
MPPPNDFYRDKLIQVLGRFVPVVARGLALGFFVLAIATVVFDGHDDATVAERYWLAGVYAAIGAGSLLIARAVASIVRRLSR